MAGQQNEIERSPKVALVLPNVSKTVPRRKRFQVSYKVKEDSEHIQYKGVFLIIILYLALSLIKDNFCYLLTTLANTLMNFPMSLRKLSCSYSSDSLAPKECMPMWFIKSILGTETTLT